VPLVQGENMRFKIAKIAAAMAGCVFSERNNGEVLWVTEGCVETAIHFLHACYRKPSMAYNHYSVEEHKHTTLASEENVMRLMAGLGSRAVTFVDGLLDSGRVDVIDILNLGGVDREEAQRIMSSLIALRAIRKWGQYYVKTQAFTALLRKLVRRWRVKPPGPVI